MCLTVLLTGCMNSWFLIQFNMRMNGDTPVDEVDHLRFYLRGSHGINL